MAKPLQALVVALALAASPAMAKSLHWRDLDVAARLDRDGRLHVSERQTIVFDGDWNGGERTFRVPAGQSLEFESIARVDGGAERPFQRGDLSRVDHYDFTSPNVLRWRSRLPDDPPFANTAITYVLRYTLLGVLRETDGAYRLSHDFAFPDRSGVIERFALQFDLDPVWRGVQSPIRIARRGLLPGQSVVVRESLTYGGPGSPAAAVHALSLRIVYGVLVLFAFAMLFLLFDFFVDEQPKGRFAPLLSPDAIDESWLAENLLVLKPEVAGAALDGKVGADEVAAVLARMTHEKKIASSVETRRRLLKKRQVLRLELLVDRKALSGYESDLVRRLFFDGRTTTSTDALQTHYRSSGFDPAKIVEKGVTPVLQRFEAWGKDRRRADWKRDSVYLGAGLALLIVAAVRGGNDSGVAIFVLFAGLILLGCAVAAANWSARAVTHVLARFAIPALFLAPLITLVVRYSLKAGDLLLHVLTPVAICAWALAITKMTVDGLRSPETPEKIAFRKRLAAARNYFIAQLRSREPRLRDEWYPYALAFGLGKHVERWFGAHGNASGSSSITSSATPSSSSSGGGWSWSGGGGAFGGAGSTGGWALAAGTLAAGVSAPSSGGSGGGSSSSSSSGGGGGGGW